MEQKLKVGILGATGMVGQRFISLLEDHHSTGCDNWYLFFLSIASLQKNSQTKKILSQYSQCYRHNYNVC